MEIITNPLTLNLHGFSGVAVNKDYAGTAFKLMNKMWQTVKAHNLKNKGRNIWVYDPNEKVFAGVELDAPSTENTELEHKIIILKKYAYYKHVGPYNLIKQAGTEMRREIEVQGLKIGSPYIEIYGHWTNDESKLETELLMALE
jgi:effector-binding domain-containing protein